ncbi:MAG TPA: hypothetical protein VM821_02160 [Abditibacteriaceae bacterium]|nr:hypothetical protein [Abditibacteriaceae bacterium]
MACAQAGGTGWGISDSRGYSMREYSMLSPWRDSGLWNKPQGTQGTQAAVSRQALTQALAQQIPILGMAQSWRNTFRGEGATGRREFKLAGGDGADGLFLSIGSQQLPSFQFLGLSGNAVGAGLKWGRFSFGSTTMNSLFQKFADTYDSATNGTEKPKARDASTYTWMTAQAFNGSRGTIDLVMMRVNRDLTPWQVKDKKMQQGTSMGARADLKLWADWKMRGEWMNNRRKNGDAANAWHLELNGPLRNPLGVTQINFWLDERQPGFASMNDMNPNAGYSNQKLSLQQNIALGDMKTALQWTQVKNANLATKLWNGNERNFASTESKADMTWKLSTAMSLSANYHNLDTSRLTATGNGLDLNNNATRRQEVRANLNWKLSPAISTTFNFSSLDNEQSTDTGKSQYLNGNTRQEMRADMNWKLSKSLSGAASYSNLNTSYTTINGTHSFFSDLTRRQEMKANFDWKVSPSLSLVANISNAATAQDISRSSSNIAIDSNISKRQEVGGGLQWKVSKTISMSATASRITSDTDLLAAGADDLRPLSRQTDQQLALAISRRTGAGSWSLQFTQHTLNDAASATVNTRGQTLQLQTERKVLPNLKVKGAWNVSSDDDIARRLANERATHNLEAQWALSSRSNLSLNYRDWNTIRQQLGGTSFEGSNELGLRFNWGSAVKGNGLGLAMEYAKRDTPNPLDREKYRVGLTYK